MDWSNRPPVGDRALTSALIKTMKDSDLEIAQLTPASRPKAGCPLVFACDADFAMPLATTLRSVAEANAGGYPLDVYVLSNGFSEDVKRRILDSMPTGSFSISWLPVDLSVFSGFSTLRHISTATYARFLIPRVLPKGVRRLLYLDADILVLDSLMPILELDLDGAVLGAVVDERLTAHIQAGKTSLPGLPRVREYFNAGVLLIDLDLWREERISERALEYLEHNPDSPYSDQDALNVACDGRWKKLGSRWNYYQIDLERPLSELDASQRPSIIHFQGWSKPWDAGTLNVNTRFYDDFRSRTSFACKSEEKLTNLALVVWARLKRTLKRSALVNDLWGRVRSLLSDRTRNRGKRLSA